MAPNRFFSLRSLLTIGILVGGFFLLVNSVGVRAATYEAPKRAFPEGNPDLPTTSTLYEVLTQSAAAANGMADASNFSGDIVIGKADKATKLKLSAGNPGALTSVLELGSARNAWRFQMTANHGLYLRPLDHPSAQDPDFHITNQAGTPFVSFSPDVGRVGIGTTDPGAELEIVGKQADQATALKVISDGNADDKVFHFIGNSTLEPYQMVMMQTGNVGVGYTNPGTAKLAVNGSVGIGTTSPNRSLTIENSAGSFLNLKYGTQHEVLLGVDGNGAILSAMTDSDLIFRAGTNNEKMRIQKNGNVGIGTASPDYALDIESPNEFPLSFQRTGTSAKRWALGSDDNGFELKNVTDNKLPLYITNTGNVGIGFSDSTGLNTKLHVKGGGRFEPTAYQYVSIGERTFNGTPPASMYTACPSGVSGPSFDAGNLRVMYCYVTRTANSKYEFYELRPKTANDGSLLAETVKAFSRVDIGASNRDMGFTYGIDDAALEVAKPIFSRIGMVGLKTGIGDGSNSPQNVRFIVDARADKDIGGDDRAQIGTLSDHPLIFMTKDTVRMWLDNKGGLGIYGVNAADPAPLTLYHPTKSSVVSIATKGTDSLEDDVRMDIGSRNDGANSFGELNVTSDHDLKISTKGLERMVITNTGNVAIGNGSPGWPQLYVEGDVNFKKGLWIDGAGGWGDESRDSLVVNNSIRIRAFNKDMLTALNFERTDEDGRMHNWKWWHMKADGYRKNALELWEYKTDSNGKSCGGNNLQGAVCDVKLMITEGGNMGIGTVPDEKNKLQVGGKLDVRGMASVGTTQWDYEPKKIPNKNEGDWNYTLLLNADNTSSIGFHDSGHSVGSIRYKERLFTIGADDGWGTASVKFPGNLVSIGGDPDGATKLTIQDGWLSVGGTKNGALKTRHIEGKQADSGDYDNLYLQYNATGYGVTIGTVGPEPGYRLTVAGGIVALSGDINVKTGSSGDTVAQKNGSKLALATDRVGFDVAELFETESEVEVGDVLVVGSKERKLKKSSKSYEQTIVGVVSGSPAILFEGSETKLGAKENRFTKGTKAPVALTGRVPVKVSLENGAIKLGDYLTTSSKPGVAMKSNGQGPSIGIALESYSGTGEAKILVFLKEGTSTTANLEQKVENLAKELEALKKRIK